MVISKNIVKKAGMKKNIILLGILCFGIAFLASLDKWQINHWRIEQKQELRNTANLFQNRIENGISIRLNSVETLSSLFALRPSTSPEDFASFASMLLKFNPPIRALQYADAQTRVTYVYPPKGNEVTINDPMMLLKDPERGPYVQKAIEQRSASVQGPIELRQGGRGIIVRSPIFLEKEFIGLAIGVFDLPVLIEEAVNVINLDRYTYQMSNSEGRIFIKPEKSSEYFVKEFIRVADTQWTMTLFKKAESLDPPILPRLLIWFLGGGFVLVTTLLINLTWSKTQELETIVVERTSELEATNKLLIGEINEREQLDREKEKLIKKLNVALEEVKTLRGIIPICSYCKKIRNDKGAWDILEAYITQHTDATFSHGICPDCLKKQEEEIDKV